MRTHGPTHVEHMHDMHQNVGCEVPNDQPQTFADGSSPSCPTTTDGLSRRRWRGISVKCAAPACVLPLFCTSAEGFFRLLEPKDLDITEWLVVQNRAHSVSRPKQQRSLSWLQYTMPWDGFCAQKPSSPPNPLQ